MTGAVLSTGPLTRSEKLDLLEFVPAEAVQERVAELPPGELGEPVTIVLLLTLTMSSLTGLSAWLASRGKDVEFAMELEAPGIKGSVSFKARGGESAEQLAERARRAGADVAPG